MRISEYGLRGGFWVASYLIYHHGDYADWAYEKIQRPRNGFALAVNLASYYLRQPRVPTILSLVVEPVFGCNLRCTTCWGLRPDLEGFRPRFMPWEVFAKAVDQAPASVESITFSLIGEPLLHPELPRMIAHAAEHGFRTIVFTNGTLLCGEILQQLAASPLTVLNVSIEVDAETAWAIRGVDLHAVRANVEIFAGLKSPGTEIKLSLVAHEGNIARIGTVKKEWAGLARHLKVSPCILIDADTPSSRCMELWRGNLNIFTNGDVSPCCFDFANDLTIGNLYTQSIEQIIGGGERGVPNRYRQLLVQHLSGKSPERCRRCGECMVRGAPSRIIKAERRAGS